MGAAMPWFGHGDEGGNNGRGGRTRRERTYGLWVACLGAGGAARMRQEEQQRERGDTIVGSASCPDRLL